MYSFPLVLCGAIIIIKRNYYETRMRKRNKNSNITNIRYN